MVYRRHGIVLKRREWSGVYISSANRPIKLVLCDLKLSLLSDTAADSTTVYVLLC